MRMARAPHESLETEWIRILAQLDMVANHKLRPRERRVYDDIRQQLGFLMDRHVALQRADDARAAVRENVERAIDSPPDSMPGLLSSSSSEASAPRAASTSKPVDKTKIVTHQRRAK